jgi:hypothetical protein
MNFLSSLKVEGTETYQVLSYVYSTAETAATLFQEVCFAFDAKDYKIHQLHEDDWPVGIVLAEAIFSEADQAVSAIIKSNLTVTNIPAAIGSICMFDGAFNDYKEVLSPLYAEHIYSVWMRQIGLNIAMDERLRASDEWLEVVDKLRIRVGL